MTCLVCLPALHEARRNLDRARCHYTQAHNALLNSREKLDQVVDQAFQQQSFRPLAALFYEEEAALALCEQAVARLAAAEERWCAVRAALAIEEAMM